MKVIRPIFDYKKSESFKTYYVTGALGGFRNPYDFRLAFYNVDTTKFLIDTQPIKQNKELTQEEKNDAVTNTTMEQKVLCEMIMSERAVIELHDFLGREIARIEEIRKNEQSES